MKSSAVKNLCLNVSVAAMALMMASSAVLADATITVEAPMLDAPQIEVNGEFSLGEAPTYEGMTDVGFGVDEVFVQVDEATELVGEATDVTIDVDTLPVDEELQPEDMQDVVPLTNGGTSPFEREFSMTASSMSVDHDHEARIGKVPNLCDTAGSGWNWLCGVRNQ